MTFRIRIDFRLLPFLDNPPLSPVITPHRPWTRWRPSLNRNPARSLSIAGLGLLLSAMFVPAAASAPVPSPHAAPASHTLFPRATTVAPATTSPLTPTAIPLLRTTPNPIMDSNAPMTIADPPPSSVADAQPVNDGMKSSGDAFAFRWDAGVILALVLVCVFAMGVGTIVLRHYLRRRRHRLTMAALANMRSGGGGGGGAGGVAGRDPIRVATINGLAGRQGQVSSMARAQEGSGAMYAAAHRGTMSSNRFYSPHHQAYLGGIGSAATAPAVKRPLSGSGHRGGGIARTPASRSVAADSSTMGNSKGSSSATLAPSPSSSSSSSPITPLLQVPPQLPLPAGLTINTSLAQDSQIGGYDDTLEVVATKRQTVHSIQWIPAPSSAISSPLDMADSNSTIDFLDALQLAPPVPQLPQPALLRVCNTGSSCMSIASDYSSSPLSASPASSYCSIASSATVRPSSTASSVASFASVATVGPSSSIASSHRAPGMTPSRAFSASTTGSAPLIPSTHRSTSLSHMFPVGVRGSAPPSVMSATSSGTGSYFGSPQIGPVKALPRSTSLSPLQI